jgi:hypothetical protein
MTWLARPIVAIGFGAFLVCAETCLHFESFLSLPQSWLSLPIHDWVAGCFLIYGGVRSNRDWRTGRLYQLAAWAFNASLMCGAFFAHLEEWSSNVPADGWISAGAFLIIIGVLFAVSVGGLVSTIALTSPPPHDAPA